MGSRVIKILLVAVLPLLCGCSENFPGFDSLSPGTYEHKLALRVYGSRRSYLLHIPKGYEQAPPAPLVVALHGGLRTAWQMKEESGFSELADREGCIVLYPDGPSLFGWLAHWNAGHCCGQAMKDGIDDVGFLSLIIEQTCQRMKVDRSRIYLVGYSNGGMLAYLFAAQRPETLAAVATIAATIGSRPSSSESEVRIPPPKSSVPILAFHGREDDVVPYDAGGFGGGWGHVYVPVRESMAFWIKANQTAPHPQREKLLAGRVLRERWSGNHNRGEIVLYTLEGWKHHLPTKRHTQNLAEGDPLKDFHAAEHIWEFFKGHRR
jgi:polyhydroxybutyrate depolymerase